MFCKVMTNNPDLCHELLELIIGHKIGKQGKSEPVKALDNAVQKARNHEEWRQYGKIFKS